MDREREAQKVILFFVPKHLVRQAVADMQYNWSCGFSWIRSCDYLSEDKIFAVQVVMSSGYPFIEDTWKKKWQE